MGKQVYMIIDCFYIPVIIQCDHESESNRAPFAIHTCVVKHYI